MAKFYCTTNFYKEISKLKKNNSYKSVELDLIENLFCLEDESQIFKLNIKIKYNSESEFVKKRLKGSGGYRLYFYFYKLKSNIYLSFIHPKKGSFGMEDMLDKQKAVVYEETLNAIKTNTLIEIKVDCIQKSIIYHTTP